MRAHESLRRLIVFCGNLTDDEQHRPLTGFAFSTVLRQLEHTIGAEVYWQTVVTRGYTEEATLPDMRNVAATEVFRQQTASATRAYLDRATETELNAPRQMVSDPGQTRLLRPADVIMRVVTHIFNAAGIRCIGRQCRRVHTTRRRNQTRRPIRSAGDANAHFPSRGDRIVHGAARCAIRC